MRLLVRLAIGILIALAFGAKAATAAPIVCNGDLDTGHGYNVNHYDGSIDPAIPCEGPFTGNDAYGSGYIDAFGYTWLAQDKDDDDGPLNGASEGVLMLTGNRANGNSEDIRPVPEPGSLLLLGSGFGAAMLRRRRASHIYHAALRSSFSTCPSRT